MARRIKRQGFDALKTDSQKFPTQQDIELVEKLAAFGVNTRDIAAILEVSPNYFGKARVRDKNLREAWARGKAKGVSKMSQKLFQTGMNGDVQAMKYYLSRKGGWEETINVNQRDKTLESVIAQSFGIKTRDVNNSADPDLIDGDTDE